MMGLSPKKIYRFMYVHIILLKNYSLILLQVRQNFVSDWPSREKDLCPMSREE